MFSIIIPSFNNLEYLRICIESLKKNSFYKNEILVHLNIGADGSKEFLKSNKIQFTHTDYNSGICLGDMASKLAKHELITYAHDDFYFCPDWINFYMTKLLN